MTEAGADVIVAHMGLTTSGDIGVETALDLDGAAERVQNIHDVVTAVDEDAMVISTAGRSRGLTTPSTSSNTPRSWRDFSMRRASNACRPRKRSSSRPVNLRRSRYKREPRHTQGSGNACVRLRHAEVPLHTALLNSGMAAG